MARDANKWKFDMLFHQVTFEGKFLGLHGLSLYEKYMLNAIVEIMYDKSQPNEDGIRPDVSWLEYDFAYLYGYYGINEDEAKQGINGLYEKNILIQRSDGKYHLDEKVMIELVESGEYINKK